MTRAHYQDYVRPARAAARGQRPPVPVVLPADPRVRDLDVSSHALETYDDLTDRAIPTPDELA